MRESIRPLSYLQPLIWHIHTFVNCVKGAPNSPCWVRVLLNYLSSSVYCLVEVLATKGNTTFGFSARLGIWYLDYKSSPSSSWTSIPAFLTERCNSGKFKWIHLSSEHSLGHYKVQLQVHSALHSHNKNKHIHLQFSLMCVSWILCKTTFNGLTLNETWLTLRGKLEDWSTAYISNKYTAIPGFHYVMRHFEVLQMKENMVQYKCLGNKKL